MSARNQGSPPSREACLEEQGVCLDAAVGNSPAHRVEGGWFLDVLYRIAPIPVDAGFPVLSA